MVLSQTTIILLWIVCGLIGLIFIGMLKDYIKGRRQMNEEIKQILLNQSVMFVALAAIYADDCDDVEVLNQISRRHKELTKLLMNGGEE